MSLHGIPKILLRNAIPSDSIKKNVVDDYEVTPMYIYNRDEKTGKVTTREEPWIVKDDDGVDSLSLLPAPVVVGLLRQLVQALNLK